MHNIECIDTGKVRPRERLDFWNEQAGDKVTPVVVDKIGNGDFSGVLTARNTSCFSLSFLRATPSRVLSRSLGQHRGIVTFSLIKKGTAYSRSGGYEAQLMPNDFVMYDSDTVLEAVYPEGIELLSIRLSAVDLELYLPRARELVGRRVPGTSKSGIVFSQFINCVWDQVETDPSEDWLQSLDCAIGPMIQLAYASEMLDLARDGRMDASRRGALIRIIDERLHDPTLNTASLACALNVSERCIQLAFAQMGQTPTAYIRNRRLDLAANWLAVGRRNGARVTDICFDAGFNDISSFCRNFRERFGVSPSQYRLGKRK